jgi:hypothetical protein
MAASDVALNIVLKATDDTKVGLDSATTNLSKMEKATTAAKIAFGALTGVVASSLVGALSDAARRGADEEASLTRLAVAAGNTAEGFDASSAALKAAADVARQYGFATVEINDALALLTEQTGSADEAMRRIQVAENLARGAHIDLYTASKLLGKATDENSAVLARYGVVVQKGADVTTMLGAVQEKFGGQAVAYGNSTAGAIDKTTVAIADWTAKIGNSLGPAQQYIALLPGMTAGLQLAGGAAGGAGAALNALTGVTLAAAAPVIAVTAAVVLAGVALYEIGLTVKEVTDHWNVFVYALENSRLNDIPVFGFFFSKIQMVLGAIQNAIGLWNQLTSIFAGAQAMQQQAAVTNPNVGAAIRGFAAGGDFITTGPELIRVGEAGPERVQISPLGSNSGNTPQTIITQVFLNGTQIATAVGSTFTQQRRLQGLA